MREEYGAKLVEAKTRDDAYAVINAMLGELEQSHFRLFNPTDVDAAGPAAPPLEVRWVEDELVVVRSTASGHIGPVRPGATLHAIGDTTAASIIERARQRSRSEAEFPGVVARMAMARLSCERPGLAKKVTVTDPGKGDAQVVRVIECEAPKGEPVSLGNLDAVPTSVESRIVDGTKIGYLAFNVWMLPMVQKIEKAVAQMRRAGMQSLIIDLRGNPGGVGPMSVPVARLLLSESASLGKLELRKFAQEFNVEPGNDPFTGDVVLLVDEGTASTSEIFATGLRDLGRVTIFGARPSAGAALPSLIEKLEGGAVLQYVVGDYHSPKGTVIEGKGVVPDHVVPEARADFAAGRDPVLEAAIEHLKE
jgi:carboxyl-terminal processing protease